MQFVKLKLKRVVRLVRRIGGNMRQGKNGACRMRSLIGTLTVLAIGYMVAKNLPDVLRYIRISRM